MINEEESGPTYGTLSTRRTQSLFPTNPFLFVLKAGRFRFMKDERRGKIFVVMMRDEEREEEK